MTAERVRRGDDERLYQPRIHSRWIRELHRIKVECGQPMTVLIDQAVAEFVQRRRSESHGEPLDAKAAPMDSGESATDPCT